MSNLAILNQWLILNANGDWERTYGFNIRSTSDPGWQIDIDLKDTCMEAAVFEMEVQEIDDLTYFRLFAAQNKLRIYSGVYGLEQALTIFSEKVMEYANPDYYYKVYHPFVFEGTQIGWIPLKAYVKTINTLIIAKTFKLTLRDIIPDPINTFDFRKLPAGFLDSVYLECLLGRPCNYRLKHTELGNVFLELAL